jgi:uncharacterized protein YgbK (DUF1537 family)
MSNHQSPISNSRSRPEIFAALPPVRSGDLQPRIRTLLASAPDRKLVVLDDDPTGTQTVHDVPVLTTWDLETLCAEFDRPGPCFFVLTNSRSLARDAAGDLSREIARNLGSASAGRRFSLVSRSDSTLRGHFPLETDTLGCELGPFDAIVLFPYFEAGGRYTIDDVHYVAEGDLLVPAAQTPFARDPAFGYRASNLREWIEEKTGGRVQAADVVSIGIDALRVAPAGEDPAAVVRDRLMKLPAGCVCVVNAGHPRDADTFALASMMAEEAGARLLYRTAAQFVSARLGLEPRLLEEKDLPAESHGAGGLVIVGSHVPRTTEQLEQLLREMDVESIELPVSELLSSRGSDYLAATAERVNRLLAAGRDVVISTSRQLVTGADAAASLDIGRRVSTSLVEVVRRLEVRPRLLIAKGGITSSDLATHGLGVRRALVRGQILPGVPVWELGSESRFPGLNYVVFPGNVGGPMALTEALRRWRRPVV